MTASDSFRSGTKTGIKGHIKIIKWREEPFLRGQGENIWQ